MRRHFAAIAVLSLLVLVLGAWGWHEHQAKASLETAVNNNYQRAFYNLTDQVQSMEIMLGKSLVLSDPEKNMQFFENIWQQSNQALDSLTQLPVNDVLLGRTAKFITQLGSYTNVLAAQIAEGKPLSTEQWDTVNKLYDQSSDLNAELGKIHASIADGSVNLYELAQVGSQKLSKEGEKLANGNFQIMNRQMQVYPTLIYDGPFSDHLEQGAAKGLTGGNITQNKAKTKALEFYDDNGNKNVQTKLTGEVDGNIKAFRVEINANDSSKNKESTVADVSIKGGQLIWLVSPRNITQSKLSIAQAQIKANDYLLRQGYKGMQSSYYQKNAHSVTFNYAYTQNGVKIYPDLVKVTVALDNGQIVSIDARGYLMSHTERTLEKPQITEQQARMALSNRIDSQGKGRLALIPVGAGAQKEVLTWEFTGERNGETYLIYINALTGDEENALRLIDSSRGKLTL